MLPLRRFHAKRTGHASSCFNRKNISAYTLPATFRAYAACLWEAFHRTAPLESGTAQSSRKTAAASFRSRLAAKLCLLASARYRALGHIVSRTIAHCRALESESRRNRVVFAS